MISKLLLFFFLLSILNANGIYNSNILDIQGKVFPKMIILDKNIEKKTLEEKIVFTILYENIDINTAFLLKERIEKNYNELKNFDLIVKLKRFDDFNEKEPLSTAYYFLIGDKNKIIKINDFLILNSRLTFSYDDTYLDSGIIFSLKQSFKIDLFLNLQSLKNSKIELENSIFNLVKIR